MTDTLAIAAIAAHFHAATCRAASLNAACDGATTADFELARYALAAALPHLPGHQRDAYEAGYEAAFESWSELLDCAGVWPPGPQEAFRAGWQAGATRAADAERERIRQLAIDHNALYLAHGDERQLTGMLPLADLLAGTAYGAHTPGGTT